MPLHTSIIPSTINPDINKERQNASFSSEEFAIWFHGGADNLNLKRLVEKELYSDKHCSYQEEEYLCYKDAISLGIGTAVELMKKLTALQDRLNPGGTNIFPYFMTEEVSETYLSSGNPFDVHFLMFIRALNSQAQPELRDKYAERATRCEIIGTYCQTELGHGSHLKALETTAHYDRATDEFVLNTPTLTSYKWWPGGLAHTVNYAIVVAQLLIDNECKGIELFLVQLRDEATHMPLPGIQLGDIGIRVFPGAVNNGYLCLKNVRIPRNNMFMKNNKVLPGGEYVAGPVNQLNYFPMVYVRCRIVRMSAYMLSMAATITTRYSAVRRQGTIERNEPEVQIIDHRSQQLKVLPEISNAIAYHLAARVLYQIYEETSNSLAHSDFTRLAELHALACILKVSCSYDSAHGIERCRLACGGHSYLAASNFQRFYYMALTACTYEGENSVLYMQVGRILLKSWSFALKGIQLMPTLAYLSEFITDNSFPKWTGTWHCMTKAFQYVAANKTRIAFNKYTRRIEAGQTDAMASNNTAIDMIQAAELHGRAFVANTFLLEVTGPGAAKRSASFNAVLENLLELFLLNITFRHLTDLLRFINLSEEDISDLEARLEMVLGKVRTDAVAIVDGFDFHDHTLRSVLGAYDGNVYERIFESAQISTINNSSVLDVYHSHLKPFMQSKL